MYTHNLISMCPEFHRKRSIHGWIELGSNLIAVLSLRKEDFPLNLPGCEEKCKRELLSFAILFPSEFWTQKKLSLKMQTLCQQSIYPYYILSVWYTLQFFSSPLYHIKKFVTSPSIDCMCAWNEKEARNIIFKNGKNFHTLARRMNRTRAEKNLDDFAYYLCQCDSSVPDALYWMQCFEKQDMVEHLH